MRFSRAWYVSSLAAGLIGCSSTTNVSRPDGGAGADGGTDGGADGGGGGAASTAVQSWRAPTAWGGLWQHSSTMVQHAWFDGTGLVEDPATGISWAAAGFPTPPRPLGVFPGVTRYGVGPFGNPDAYIASGDDPLGKLTGDILVCAVVKPQLDPVDDNDSNKTIVAKGVEGESGWVLMQMHRSFCFHYEDGLDSSGRSNAGNTGAWMIWTSAYIGDDPAALQATFGFTELNPSYVVVCGGRAGNDLAIAMNSAPDTINRLSTEYSGDYASLPGAPLVKPDLHHATIGNYDSAAPEHGYRGRIYETAVWAEAATADNMQAKMAAILGLGLADGSVARYSRSSEAPFTGADGKYHTAGRHAPRIVDLGTPASPGPAFLFGLQGWNRVKYPEALDLWSGPAGAVVADTSVPVGDSERRSADQVTLGPGQALTPVLWGSSGMFAPDGAIQGQIWLRRISTSGTLRIVSSASNGGAQDVDLSMLGSDWTRVYIHGLKADATGSAAVSFESPVGLNGSPLVFEAWGAVLTELAGGGDVGAFDPGPGMYAWLYPGDGLGGYPPDPMADVGNDRLTLPDVPRSTGSGGYCLSARAQPPAGLAWAAAFPGDRTILEWKSDDGASSSRLLVEATTAGRVCLEVKSAVSVQRLCAPPSAFGDGSQHEVTGCVAPAGGLSLYFDGISAPSAIASSAPASAAPGPPLDLSTGHLTIGNSGAGASVWNGYVSSALACSGPDPATCQ